MKEKSLFRKTLEYNSGKTNFTIMILFTVLTFVISVLWSDKKWYDIGVMVTSFMSLAAGTQFCKALLAVKSGKDPDSVVV